MFYPEPLPDMGLEDERKMLTGSGDPKEVRPGEGRGPGSSPPEPARGPRGPASTSRPLECAGQGELAPLTPRIRRVTLGE